MIGKVELLAKSGCFNVSKCLKTLERRLKEKSSGCFGVSKCFKTLERRLKEDSSKIVQTCVDHCEYVAAHRVHRGRQVLSLYCRLWGRGCLQILVKNFKLSKSAVFAVMASSYDWNKERIQDQEILRYSAEFSLIEFLLKKQSACLKGALPTGECKCSVCTATDSEWQPFIEKDDVTVWKREDVNHRGKGLYCYKMYGKYSDVTAYDFLEAQVDLDYRLSWDTHAVKLELLDSEPSTNSDVIYWETKWPSLFTNRDYVFMRRYRVDTKRNLLFLVNRNATHPAKPPGKKPQRVSEYWSYMIIKPKTSFDKPGLEFSTTYFDNPGANVPSSMMTWVTTSAMPDYLKKLRLAALGLNKKRGGAPSALAGKDAMSRVSEKDEVNRAVMLFKSLKRSMYLF